MSLRKWGIAACLVLVACGAPAVESDLGPTILFDLGTAPLPDVPFPNDLLTRPDPASPTGIRLSFATDASTQLMRSSLARMQELSGFGTYQPITVRFDSPLDLSPFFDGHRDFLEPGRGDYELEDDAVFVVDISPESPTFLEAVPLDFGEGNFPALLPSPNAYWEHDPKTATKSFLFETVGEDRNGNDKLDPGEDVDLDGILDRPNADPRQDGDPGTTDSEADLISFYDYADDTLIFRPILPLAEGTTYAVVITNRVVGREGAAVESPLPSWSHEEQTDVLTPVADFMATRGLETDDIAFAWSFTTQVASRDLVTLRDGLYGGGPLAWLEADNPPALAELSPMLADGEEDNTFILPAERLELLIGPLAQAGFQRFGVTEVDQLVEAHRFFDYHVSGVIKAPRLGGLNPAARTPDEQAWPANLDDPALRGAAAYDDLRFWCSVPRKEFWADPDQPPPVALYAHGYTSNKLEQLGLALYAKFGIATCGIDALGHGIEVGEQEAELREAFDLFGIGPAADVMLDGRAVDVDGDGADDIGAEFFTAHMFQTRDNLRQTVLDWLTLVRFFRAFGEQTMGDLDGDGEPEQLGDFNADGQLDFGGPDAAFFASGTSLGALVSSILGVVEPQVVAVAPISGGAGLLDLLTRSRGAAASAVVLRMFGPLIVGEPATDGSTRVYQLFVNGNNVARREIASVPGIEPGQVIRVLNRSNGDARCGLVMPDSPPPAFDSYQGWEGDTCEGTSSTTCRPCAAGTYACDLARTFRIGIPADAGDLLTVQVLGGEVDVVVGGRDRACALGPGVEAIAEIQTIESPIDYRGQHWEPGADLVALEAGFGLMRATPALRDVTTLGQIVVTAADPATYAPFYSREALSPGDPNAPSAPTHLLNVVTLGDANVPAGSGVALARIAGIVGLEGPDPRFGKTANRVLIDEGVVEGIGRRQTRGAPWGPLLVDVDNLSNSANATPGDPAGAVDGLLAPRLDPALRLTGPTPCMRGDCGGVEGQSALVLPMLDAENGAHGFAPPGLTESPFDVGQYMAHQIGIFFRTAGTEIRFHPCLATAADCDDIPAAP